MTLDLCHAGLRAAARLLSNCLTAWQRPARRACWTAAIAAAIAAAVAPALALAAPVAHGQVPLRIIAINDLHGHLEPGDNAVGVPHPQEPGRTVPLRSGGVAHLATRVRALRAEVPHSVFISAGDLVGASPLTSALFRDEPAIEAMNALGLDLNAVGNHEFDHGVAELQRLVAGGCASAPRGAAATCGHPNGQYLGARFPFLAANVANADGRPLFAPALVREFDGVRVGFIGAVTRVTPGIVRPEGIRGWRFEREAAAVNRAARALRAQGVRAIVAVIHEGGEADGGFNACDRPRGAIFDIERELDPAVDMVFSAHTHRAYNCRIDGRLVIQGASFGRLVSVVDVELDRASGEVRRERVRAVNLPVPNGLDAELDAAVRTAYPVLPPDAGIARLVAHYRDRAASLADRGVGRIAASFTRRSEGGGDHAAGRLIADAQLAATRSNGAQIALTNPGGVRSDLLARPPDGHVSYGDLFGMQPFGNALVTLTLTGAQFRALLESQWSRTNPDRVRFLQPSAGLTYTWHGSRPHGQRIDPESMRLHGSRIAPEDRLRVTVNDFLATGGDGFAVLRDATERVGGPLDIEALASYVSERSAAAPLAPDRRPRIERAD
jgi:5'-nucleotidase